MKALQTFVIVSKVAVLLLCTVIHSLCTLLHTSALVWQPCNAALHDMFLGKPFEVLLLALRSQEAFLESGHVAFGKGLDALPMFQVKFSADGNFLYTGARKDPEIMCWDVRYTSEVVYTMQRDTADTNQRIQFDIEPVGRHLATGECVQRRINYSYNRDNNYNAIAPVTIVKLSVVFQIVH